MELAKAVELFLKNQRPTTRESYRYVLKAMLAYIGTARPVEAVTHVDMIEYHQHLDTKNYAIASFNKHVKTIKTLFNWMVKLKVLPESPASEMKRKRQRMYVSRDKAMSDDELARLLDHVLNHPHKTMFYRCRDYAMILFLADTGCRIGGAAGLKVEDLDLEKRRGIVTEKGDKQRPVKYGDLCASALTRLLLIRPRTAGRYVFSKGALPMKANNISLQLRRLCHSLGIRTLSGHTLRHRKGHQFADAKVAPTLAARALGHDSVQITLDYYYPTDYESAFAELDKLQVTSDLVPQEAKPVIEFPRAIGK